MQKPYPPMPKLGNGDRDRWRERLLEIPPSTSIWRSGRKSQSIRGSREDGDGEAYEDDMETEIVMDMESEMDAS